MRKRQFLSALLFLLMTATTGWSQAAKPSGAEQELRAIEEQRREAIKQGDFTTLDRIYADDFSAVAGNGQIVDKPQLFAVFKRTDPSVAFVTDEIRVRVFGETAIFRGRLVGKTADGKTVSAGRFTHLFVRRDGRWQCVAGQSTPIGGQ
jgi:ketosteroid isomerase-like protein